MLLSRLHTRSNTIFCFVFDVLMSDVDVWMPDVDVFDARCQAMCTSYL